jgi:hypothetical protein
VKTQASDSVDPVARLLPLIRSVESRVDYNEREFKQLRDDVFNLRMQVRSRVVELERRVVELERRGR